MNILAIETSCDETALSIVKAYTEENISPNFTVLSDLVISQIDIHIPYGGVFPAMAKREHAKNITPLLIQALKESDMYKEKKQSKIQQKYIENILEREPECKDALSLLVENIEIPSIDMISVTHGPGLAPALWVGINFARALSAVWNIPILPINHMEGHITSILVKKKKERYEKALFPVCNFIFPMISLLISGGHTQLVLIRDWTDYIIIGETIDDAVGEAFDKTARMLDMQYPGGPKISKKARQGNKNELINLPRPMLHSPDYLFSFSGLKTSVRYLIQDLKKQNAFDDQVICDIAREFEHAVTEVLLTKTCRAIKEYNARGLIIAGGVSANTFITESFKKKVQEYKIPLYIPEPDLCGDNSLMIATAACIQYWKHNKKAINSYEEVVAIGNLKL